MFKTTLKTTAVLMLAACMSLTAAKDDKGDKEGKGKGNTSSANATGPAPAGDPMAVANRAAEFFGFPRGTVASATRDAADGSVSFLWIGDNSGARYAMGEVRIRRIYTVNGNLTAVETQCQKAATAEVCRSLGL